MARTANDLRTLLAEEASLLAGDGALGSALPLSAQDPDVRRILEALALFSARTRAVAEGSLYGAVKCIAGGTLDDLLCPMPAMTLLRFEPDERLTKPVRLPQGAPVRLAAPDARARSPRLPIAAPSYESAVEQAALFSTSAPLDILPVTLESAAIVVLRDGKRRLQIRLSARTRLVPPPRSLDLYVDRFGDYRASLALHVALQDHTRRAYAVLDQSPDADGATQASCDVAFGGPWPERGDEPAPLFRIRSFDPSPFLQLRSFFHHPEQSLYVRVTFPDSKPWTTVTLCFELDDGFPTDLRVDAGTFALFVVPAANLVPDPAAPIVADGTKDRYPIQSATPAGETALHSVTGVYEVGDAGLSPIPPMSLLDTGDAYELDDTGAVKWLRLRAPGAFAAPKKVLVDALWYNPSFSSPEPSRLVATLWQQRLEGVALGVRGQVVPAAPSPLAGDAERCLALLSLKMRAALQREDLVGMMRLLGARDESPYAAMPATLVKVGIRRVPDRTRGASGLNRRYDLTLRYGNPDDAPLVRRFYDRLCDLLRAWTEETVEIAAKLEQVPDLALLAGGASP